jgi:hypothetical protein
MSFRAVLPIGMQQPDPKAGEYLLLGICLISSYFPHVVVLSGCVTKNWHAEFVELVTSPNAQGALLQQNPLRKQARTSITILF